MVQAGVEIHSRVWKAGCSSRYQCQVQPACKWRRYCSVVNGTSRSASVCTCISLITFTSLQDWHLRPLARSFIPVLHYLLVLAQRLCLSLLSSHSVPYRFESLALSAYHAEQYLCDEGARPRRVPPILGYGTGSCSRTPNYSPQCPHLQFH